VEIESAINSISSFELEIATRNSKTGLILKSQNDLCAMESKEMTACQLLRRGNFHSTYIIAFKRNFFSFLIVLKEPFPVEKYSQLRLCNSSSEI